MIFAYDDGIMADETMRVQSLQDELEQWREVVWRKIY